MSLGAMFVLLIVSVIVLPMIVRYINRIEPHFVISGFQDLQNAAEAVASDAVQNIPSVSGMSAPSYHPDKNTNYMCRSVNGQPCPEGTRCDGITNSCIPLMPKGSNDVVGYYA